MNVRPLWILKAVTDELRNDRAGAGPSLDRIARSALLLRHHLQKELVVNVRAFFVERPIFSYSPCHARYFLRRLIIMLLLRLFLFRVLPPRA